MLFKTTFTASGRPACEYIMAGALMLDAQAVRARAAAVARVDLKSMGKLLGGG